MFCANKETVMQSVILYGGKGYASTVTVISKIIYLAKNAFVKLKL